MTLRSSFSKEVKSEMRRNIWAPVLSLIGFLFCLPLPVAIVIQNYYESITGLSNAISDVEAWKTRQFETVCRQMTVWLTDSNVLAAIGIFIMATLCGVALFRYLHDRRQVDLFHALPVSRTHLFAVRYVTGVVSVLPFYIVIHLLTAAVVFAMGFGAEITFGTVVKAIGMNALFFLLLYAIAILCTVLTGNTVITVVLGLWMSFFIPAFVGLITMLQQQYYTTYCEPSMLMEKLLVYGSPLIAYFMQVGENIFGVNSDYGGPELLIIYAVLTIALTAICLVLFRIRRSERAGAAMAFEGSKLPVKAVVCVILALAGYLFFENVIGSFWSWFGLVVFLVMGHALVEIIYHFDFRKALSHLPHMLMFGVVSVALILCVRMDVTGFDRYRPDDEDIAGMRVQIWGDFGSGSARHSNIRDDHWLTDPELIDDIMALVDEGIEYHAAYGNRSIPYQEGLYSNIDLTVAWKLDNGRRVTRTYNFNSSNANIHSEIIGIVHHPDFLRVYSDLQQLDPAQWGDSENAMHIRTAEIPDGGVASGSVFDKNDITRLLTAMQQAELTRDAEIMRNEAPVLRVDIRYTEEDANYTRQCDYRPIYACDTEVLAIVKELTGVEPIALTSEHVKTIEIERNIRMQVPDNEVDFDVYYEKYGEIMTETADAQEYIDSTDKVLIEDPAVIDQILKNGVPAGMQTAAAEWFETDEMTVEDDLAAIDYGVRITLHNNWERLAYTKGSAPLELLESLFETE
ncbi:MAG: ABC transporter permease [Butyricicoccus sp.]|nr:ABC transporter permease [Butyricicoccus sp.]